MPMQQPSFNSLIEDGLYPDLKKRKIPLYEDQ